MVESAARAADLPLEFFARVIWQESRFQTDAVGPVTRSGQRAQGIAQFMPGTASERRLLDPFDPVQALPKSAEFLGELRDQFGNLGLAAAAYNAGPRRVQEWLAGTGYMPQETRNYVSAITGSTVEEWANAGRNGKMPERAPASSCRELMALAEARAQSLRDGSRTAHHAGGCEIVGRAACGRLQPRQGAGDVCARDEAAQRRDRRSGPEPAQFGDANARHASRSTRCGSAPTRDPRPMISATASAAPAGPASCCGTWACGGDQNRHGATSPGASFGSQYAAMSGLHDCPEACLLDAGRVRQPYAGDDFKLIRLHVALPPLDSPNWQSPLRAFAWGLRSVTTDRSGAGAVRDLSRHRRARP